MRGIATRARQGAFAALCATMLAASTHEQPFPLSWPLGALDNSWRGTADSTPRRLSDADFWGMVTTMSEPGGFFRSDNLVSNEVTFQHAITALQQTLGTGGV